MKKVLLIICLLQGVLLPQSFRLMTYNLLNYPGNDTIVRNPYFRTTLSYVNPDIVVVQEITSQAGVNGFLNNVLNSYGQYSAGVFIDGTFDTENAIFYKDSLFSFISNTPIKTQLRDINQFKLLVKPSGDTLIIYSVHLKASNTTEDAQRRAAEVDSLRKVTNQLSANSHFFVVGDFNVYTSNEQAYQKLLNQSQSGYFWDPINSPGNWNNNSGFASVHTQSTRSGSSGGLDDRFDFILISQSVKDVGGIEFLSGTYTAVGNDGQHFNRAINELPNMAVSSEVANALWGASDHLPVYADFAYDDIIPVELISFTAAFADGSVNISWSTITETNNYGFEIERTSNGQPWETIGFVNSHGNSTDPVFYSFIDNKANRKDLKYRLKIVDLDGSYTYSIEQYVSIPLVFQLNQNYPNPFNPVTNIEYSIPQNTYVTIIVYNSIGQEVKELVNEFKAAGSYQVTFNAENLSSGIYYYRMISGEFQETRKLILLK